MSPAPTFTRGRHVKGRPHFSEGSWDELLLDLPNTVVSSSCGQEWVSFQLDAIIETLRYARPRTSGSGNAERRVTIHEFRVVQLLYGTLSTSCPTHSKLGTRYTELARANSPFVFSGGLVWLVATS